MKKLLVTLCSLASLLLGTCKAYAESVVPATSVQQGVVPAWHSITFSKKGETTSAPFQVREILQRPQSLFGLFHVPTSKKPLPSKTGEMWTFDHDGALFQTSFFHGRSVQIRVQNFGNDPMETEQLLRSFGLGKQYKGTGSNRYYRHPSYPHGYVHVIIHRYELVDKALLIEYVTEQEYSVMNRNAL